MTKTGITRRIIAPMLILTALQCDADNVNIAVASNFSHTLNTLARNFETTTGHEARISSASTGKLYAQIMHGAPFDIFLAADETRPAFLISEGKAISGSLHTYALGRLVFLSNIKSGGECIDVLQGEALKRLAIANPAIAPYGLAARQVLEKLGFREDIQSKLVMGENIAQSLQFVVSGSASAGFVAKSMLVHNTAVSSACEWQVPAELHDPIRQTMVLLNNKDNNPAAKAFWSYMQSETARNIIEHDGYDIVSASEAP